MRGQESTVGSLVGTGMRGLRSRMLLTVASVLLAGISVAAAVLGPMYQTGAAASYLVTKLRSESNINTGVVFDYKVSFFVPTSYAGAVADARRVANGELNDHFGPASVAVWSQRRPSTRLNGLATIVSTAGQCAHLRITGRCPSAPGEALMLRHDSDFTGVKIGRRVDVDGVKNGLRIVGVYSAHPEDSDFWFDLSNLTSIPAGTSLLAPTPYLPAPLLVTPQTFDRIKPELWIVKASRRLVVTPETSVSDLQEATAVASRLTPRSRTQLADGASFVPEIGNELVSVSQQVRERQSTARSTVGPAVVSVVLVALVLLLRLLSAAMELRRSELALASLRGFSRRQMWLLGLIEPGLTILIATPIGLVAGYLFAQALARTWLVPGLPMPLGASSVLALLVVALATVAVAALVVRDALGETLAAQIAGVRRPGRSGRWGLLLRLVLIASAIAVLVATLAASEQSSPDATDLVLPILLAVAAGLITTSAAQGLARWWAAWTVARRGMFTYIASRTISRRREGTLVILPLTAALAVSIFAAGVFTAAADWRASDAATVVGADVAYPTKLTMSQTVALTHEVDPSGRWLMAAAAEFDGANELLVLDASRLGRVGRWPSSWTPGLTAADVGRQLAPKRPSVVLTGSRVAMTVDNQVTGDFRNLTVELYMTSADGQQSNVLLGRMRPGVSTVTARLTNCEAGCLLQQMSFGGPAGAVGVMHGSAVIRSVLVDGKPLPGFLDEPWRVAQPQETAPPGVKRAPSEGADGLTIEFDARDASAFAAVTPTDVPLVRPVVLGRTADPVDATRVGNVITLRTSAYRDLRVEPVAQAESMPVLGPAGILIDYTMLTRDVQINNVSTTVTLLARADTPSSIIAALADRGISDPETLTTARSVLDNDAFALALNLYLVVTAIVILLAVAGLAANLAVQMPARRRDAASLRVVGLRRRSLLAAVVAEFFVVLGAAALAGILAGSLAQYVVVRTVTLGYADTRHTPRLLPSLNLGSVTDLVVAVGLGLFLVAVAVAALTVRGAKTASLREDAG